MSRMVLKEMKINRRVQDGVDPSPPPRMKDPNLLRLDMITDDESQSKVSKKCAASSGVIPKIHGP